MSTGLPVAHAALAGLKAIAPVVLRDAYPDRPDLAEKLTTYLNEVSVALSSVEPWITAGRTLRILEVGSGIGAVSACLAAEGHEVVAIEPEGPGFADMAVLQGIVAVARLQSSMSSSSTGGGHFVTDRRG